MTPERIQELRARVEQFDLGNECAVHISAYLTEALDEIERLQTMLGDIQDVLYTTEELNMSNYDHDLVAQLNASFVEVCSIAFPEESDHA